MCIPLAIGTKVQIKDNEKVALLILTIAITVSGYKETSMDDVHIGILQLLKDSKNGLTQSEISNKLDIERSSIDWAYEEAGSAGKILIRTGDKRDDEQIIYLGMHGRAILLQHKELNQARYSSRTAMWIAIAALVVSIIVGTIQILTKKTINESQFSRIIDKEPNLQSLDKKFEQIKKSSEARDTFLIEIRNELKEIKRYSKKNVD